MLKNVTLIILTGLTMAFNNSVDAKQSGFQSITSAGAWNGRTLTAGTGISITNGDGTAGDPVISSTITPPPPTPSTLTLVDDFLGTVMSFVTITASGNAGVASQIGWITQGSTAGGTNVVEESGHPGITLLSYGAGPGTTFLYLNENGGTGAGRMALGYGTTTYTWIIKLPALSTGGATYKLFIGLGDTTGSVAITDQVNGVYFTYTHSESSGNWVYNTASASTRTQTSSGVAASTSWVKLQASINAAGTSVTFFINGSSVGTVTTNIPTAAITPLAQLQGATSNPKVYIDYFDLSMALTTPR